MTPGRSFQENRVAGLFLRRIVPGVVILLAVAASGDSVGSGPATSTGAQVTKSVPFVRESIDEIRALAPFREQTVPENRAIPFRRIPRRSGATGEAGLTLAAPDLAAPFFASSPALSAPVLDSSFAGLGNPPRTEGDIIPPDTMGAAGPDHLVSILNSDFGVFNKSGVLLQKFSLRSFWQSLGTGTGAPAEFPFDPKILYDQHSGRFVAVTLGGRSAPGSWVLIAVSPPSDPTGLWNKWAIDADLDTDQDNNVIQTNNSADYPGFGVDQFNVYVSANMFNGNGIGQYGKVWVIPKTQLTDNPGPTITWHEFSNPLLPGFSRQPAHTFGPAPAEYLVSEGPFTTNNVLLLTRIDNTSGTPVMQAPVSVPIVSYLSPDPFPGAPQLGLGNDNAIHTSDTRVLNVVYRNGSVWATHHVVGPSGKVEVAWYRINPTIGAIQAQGRITDPNRWYYYPSIAVNKDDVAAIGFSGSSTTEYVGGYYTVVHPSPVVAEEVGLLKLGEAPYYKVFTGTDNRWGDFSATVIDPTDDTSFWTLQEYAKLPVLGISQWGTWWGKFHPSDVAAPSGLSATVGTGVQVTLAWTDSSTNESGFRIERRTPPGGAYGIIGTVGPNFTSFVDNTDTGLTQDTNYFYRVESFDAGGGSYSNEVFVTTTQTAPPGTGGGGGGGCLSIARSPEDRVEASAVVTLFFLFLPAAAYGLRRVVRSRTTH